MMEYQIKTTQDAVFITLLVERFDKDLAPAIKAELVLTVGNGLINIVLDVSRCTYCDAAGLSAILVANRLCNNAGGKFILAGVKGEVRNLIFKCECNTFLSISDDANEAKNMI
jgi:anti-anti-sigma factor